MPAALASPTICWATLSALGLMVGCVAPNPVYDLPDGPPGLPRGGGPGNPDAVLRDGAEPDAPSGPEVASLPDVRLEPDVPSPDGAPAADAPLADAVDAPLADVLDGPLAGVLDGPLAADGPLACTAVTGSGTGLRAEYFDNSDFTGTRVSRTDASIDWDFGLGSPDSSLDSDNFSARWTGQLQAAFSGPHTFIASYNDGMRMFLDERVVMYRWGPRITTGEDRATVVLEGGRKYDLRFEFFDQGSAALARLSWESTCQSRQVVPRKQLYPVAPAAPVCPVERASGSGTGLKVEYFSGEPSQRPLATSNVGQLDVAWGTSAPAPGVPADRFSARWTGTLEAPIDGPLTIYLSTDDVGRLRLGGALLADSWSEPFGPQEVAATIDVRAGQRYDLLIEQRDDTGGAFAHLYWSWPCHPREVIPTARLYLP
jgi:hypothetical protein